MSQSHHEIVSKKRSRSGCWTCRKRHQKCDESRPTCFNCRLRGVECGGYGIILTDFTARGSRKGQMVSKMRRNRPPNHQVNTIPGISGANPTSSMENVEDATSPQSPFQLPEDPSILDVEMPLNEDLDWIILDEQDVLQEAVTSPAATGAGREWILSSENSVDIPTLDHVLCVHEPTLPPTPHDPFDQYLFTHYMDDLSLRLYPVKAQQNPYRAIYGALARESEPLLKSIMLASALHLSEQGKLPKFAIKPYRIAVQESFRKALKTQDKEWALGVTVLLSIIFDIIGTGLDTWSSKLIGCRRLLEMAISGSNTKARTGLHCVLLQYNWAVTMAKTLLQGSIPDETFDELKCIDECETQKQNIYLPHQRSIILMLEFYGSVAEKFEMASNQSLWWGNLPDYQMHLFLREATEYSVDITRMDAAGEMNEILRLMPDVADLVNRIKKWQPDISMVQPELIDSVHYFNCIWKNGMLCFVYSEIYSLGPRDNLIESLVQDSLAPLKNLSWLQACLFPFFIIAVHAQTDQARSSFEAKLNEMHRTLAFQGPLSLISILKNIWQQSDDCLENRVRWRGILKKLGAEINILL